MKSRLLSLVCMVAVISLLCIPTDAEAGKRHRGESRSRSSARSYQSAAAPVMQQTIYRGSGSSTCTCVNCACNPSSKPLSDSAPVPPDLPASPPFIEGGRSQNSPDSLQGSFGKFPH